MAFLYGDSTPSPLETNFLELLRDTLDFAVVVLEADANIERIHERKVQSAQAADEEIERLQTFGGVVVDAIRDAPKGEEDSETSRCAAHLTVKVGEAVSASTDAVHRTLAAEVAQADADLVAQREASFKALETLLLPHDVLDAKVVRRIERQPDGSHVASLLGDATIGLQWRIALAIPEGHVFAASAPLDRLAPQMEFFAPEQTGWLKKEMKPRPQRLERFALIELTDDGHEVGLKLRAIAGEHGFDFSIAPRSGAVSASRTGKEGDAPFDLTEEDTRKIIELSEKAREALAELKGERLIEATFESGDFRLHPRFRDLVERLVAQMAPIVQEIARHSLTRTELVIRRLLSNERREEIFVTKATLREKYAPLPKEQRTLFDAFGFDTLPPPAPPEKLPSEPPQVALPAPEPAVSEALRTEVAPSRPPPPPSWVRPPRSPSGPPSGPTWRRPPPRSSS
jgi:hypothetical protein